MNGDTRPGLTYVVHTLNPGGTERLVVDMSREFARDYRVEVLCLDEPGRWAGDLRRDGIAVHALWRQPGFDSSLPFTLADRFRHHRAAIVHAHQYSPWFYSALARLRYPRPRLLFEEHGRLYPEREAPLRAAVNRAVAQPLTHRLVAVSAEIRERLRRYEGLDPRRIEVIYNGVAAAQQLDPVERQALRHEFGFSPDDVVVGTVGRLDRIKNLPLLVAALEAAGASVPSLRGLVVGDGPEALAVRARAAAGPMRDRIVFTGHRANARRVVQAMDLFVLSSFSEGTSMALLEAMAAGVAAAVTAVGGNPEVVSAGETGWVVPSGDGPALSAAMIEAATEPARRCERAAAGRRRFEERFTMRRMMDEYGARYAALIGSV